MPNPDTDRNPVEVLADEFAARYRRGERPSVAEYTRRYPDHADEIEALFPSIVMMEQLKERQRSDVQAAEKQRRFTGGRRIERLGDYEIVREIGRGGMGVVFEATQASLGRRVALKVLSDSAMASEKQIRRFEREARAAAALHHTNIVPVFGVGHDQDLHFYVMQYIDGVGLDEILIALRTLAVEQQPEADGDSAALLAEALRCGSFAAPRRFGSSSSLTGSRTSSASGSQKDSRVAGTSETPVTQELARPGTKTAEMAPAPEEAALEPAASEQAVSGPAVSEPAVSGQAVSGQAASPERASSQTAPSRSTVASQQDKAVSHSGSRGQPLPVSKEAKGAAPPEGDELDLLGRQYYKSVARIGLQAADALQYAHAKHVLHRDIKPGNLLLDAQGTVWVTDFGLAKVMEQQDLTNTGDIVGTLRYMAPEQLEGRSDPRADIYSLGLTLYELLTLRPACDEKAIKQLLEHRSSDRVIRPRSLNRQIPRDLETVVLKAIAADPGHRYASAAELAEDLQRFLDDRPIQARRVNLLERSWRWGRRNPALAGLSGGVVILALLVVLSLAAGYWHAQQQRRQAELAERQVRKTLALAEQIYDGIIENIGSRGAPGLFAMDSGDEADEQVVFYETGVTPADVELLTSSLAFFEELAGQDESQAFNARNARTHRRIGDIQQRLNHRDEAVAAYRQSLEIYQRLLREDPQRVDWVVAQAEVLWELANTERAVGRGSLGFDPIRRARELLQDQPESLSHDARIRFALAQTYLQMVPPVSADSIWPRIFSGEPPRPQQQRPSREPRRRGRSGFLKRSLEALHAAEELLTELHEEDPDHAGYRLALARCYQREIRLASLSPSDLEVSCERPVQILRQLVAENAQDPRYRYELAQTLQLACTLPAYEGDRIAQLQAALDEARTLVGQFSGEAEYELLLADCLRHLGRELNRNLRYQDAQTVLAEAWDLVHSLRGRYPSVLATQAAQVEVLMTYADNLFDLGRLEQAIEAETEYQRLYRELQQTVTRNRRSPPRPPRARHGPRTRGAAQARGASK